MASGTRQPKGPGWDDGKLSCDQQAIDFANTVDWEAYGPFGGRSRLS